jgi:D-proline reductase (dithiol) PrdB
VLLAQSALPLVSRPVASVPYMERTRAWYQAQGYERPYRWARFETVPFQPLEKALSRCRLALITTAGQLAPDGQARLPKRVYSHPTATPPEHFYTEDLAWDRESTHLDDRSSFLPLEPLEEQAAAGRIGSLAPRFHGVPTEYSQRRSQEVDAPELLARLREDAVDVALLVPL